jgi:hypothetical protein
VKLLAAPQLLAKPSCRLDEHDQEKQLPFETTGNHTKNSTSSCTASHKYLQQNHGVQLKLKTKPRRRRTGDQQQVQEVKNKLGAEPGGEGKPEASHHQQQATEAVHNTITA